MSQAALPEPGAPHPDRDAASGGGSGAGSGAGGSSEDRGGRGGDSSGGSSGSGSSKAGGAAAAGRARSAPAQSRRSGGALAAGAHSRLLPASVPFRWFGAAAGFHLLAWVALAFAAPTWGDWHSGLGWPLAALHLVTVGTLLASAIGASVQLLPVATRQGVRWPRLAGALWWLFVPGMAALALGMGLARPAWLAVGAAAVLVSLLGWAVLLAANLAGARGMPGVVLHGWGALLGLVLLGLSAAALAALWLGRPLAGLPGRDALRAMHAAAGLLGVMGLLVLGLSAILLPMFALAPMPAERSQVVAGTSGLLTLVLIVLAAAVLPWAALAPAWPLALRGAAWVAAALALAVHLRAMREVLRTGMRPDLGRAGTLMRIGWGAAVAALVLAGVAWAHDAFAGTAVNAAAAGGEAAWREPLGRLVGVVAVVGWLLSFLLGVLQRILPFLASMHAAHGGGRGTAPKGRRAPTPSALTHEAALAWSMWAHVAALVLLVGATASGSAWLCALAAAAGVLGAAAFAGFFGVLAWRLRAATAPSAATGGGA